MLTFEGLDENLRFMILETENQVNATFKQFRALDPAACEAIVAKEDYLDNLKNCIEDECYKKINARKFSPRKEINEIRAVQVIAVNLERIGDQCINILRQLSHLDDLFFLDRFDYEEMCTEIRSGLGMIYPALSKRELGTALTICKAENELDQLYKTNFDVIMAALPAGRETHNLVTTLFIFRYLEKLGDLLLNIGEALILAMIGEKIKIHQFRSLQQTLNNTGFQGSLAEIDFSSILGTRSGCHIGRIEHRQDDPNHAKESIFKEGKLQKIKAEKENLARWHTLFPGLVPTVFSYQEDNDKASLLVQYLHGCSLDEIVLSSGTDLLDTVLGVVTRTVRGIWEQTRTEGAIPTSYIAQIQKRIAHIERVHPDFKRHEQRVGQARVCSSAELLELCAAVEKGLPAPFSVLIHGDFNLNNLVYDAVQQRLHYIDVYRSRQADYVQDISVFLISNFRLPVFEPALRANLNRTIAFFYAFAASLAAEWQDHTFEARLALALARSLYTSTRFENEHRFAKEMFLRAHFLLEKIVRHQAGGLPFEEFRLPEPVLYY